MHTNLNLIADYCKLSTGIVQHPVSVVNRQFENPLSKIKMKNWVLHSGSNVSGVIVVMVMMDGI